MPLDTKHIEFCTTVASIPEIVATLDNAITARTPESFQWLHEFVAAEKAGKNRPSIIKRVVAALKDWNSKPATPAVIDGHAIVLQSDDLPSLAAGIEFAQAEIDEIGRRAMRQALPLKLQQGLCCLKARHLFGIADPGKRNPSGKNQHQPEAKSDSDLGSPETSSDSDQLPGTPASFGDWIATQPLPKATAYDYMRAVEGLGLDHTATPQQVLDAYQAAATKGDLSIAKLKNLAPPAEIETPAEPTPDPNTPEVRAAEARELVHNWISTWDRSVKIGNLEHADTDTLRKLDEFLVTTRDHIRRRLKSAGA